MTNGLACRPTTLGSANRAVGVLLTEVSLDLLQPPVNVLRLSLHPACLGRNIVNLEQWRAHVLARLQRQINVSADETLANTLY